MRSESQLSDDVLRQALDAAPDGILVVDLHGTIVFVNPMVEQLFGYPHDELVGMSVDVLAARRRARESTPPTATDTPASPHPLDGDRPRPARPAGARATEFPLEISLSPLRERRRTCSSSRSSAT